MGQKYAQLIAIFFFKLSDLYQTEITSPESGIAMKLNCFKNYFFCVEKQRFFFSDKKIKKIM